MDLRNLTDAQLTEHVGRMHNEMARAKKAFEEARDEWFRRHGKEPGTAHGAGVVEVFTSPNNRWDEETARKALAEAGLSAKAIKGLEVTVLDRKKVEENLPPAWYARCQKQHGVRFNVRIT